MPQILEIFKNQSNLEQIDIKKYIETLQNLDTELATLERLLLDPVTEKVLILFYIEILSKVLKKQADFGKFIKIVLDYVEKNLIYKNSVMLLKILKTVSNTRFYLPITYYITRILEQAIKVTKPVKSNKEYTYDNIRLSNDELNREDLQMFVVSESIKLIKYQCVLFGNSIGFPELAFVICNELRNNCKVGLFKEIIGNIIKMITERKEYIEEERKKISDKTLKMKVVLEFEKNLNEWSL